MTVDGFVDASQQGEASTGNEPIRGRMRRLDEALLVALRKGFESREAGSLKGWH